MMEFMDDDELIAEFHKAGLYTDDERAERRQMQRRWKTAKAQHDAVALFLARNPPTRGSQAFAYQQQQALAGFKLSAHQRARRQSAVNSIGGGLGSLLGGLGGIGR